MRSRFGTRLVKAFLSSFYAILYCVLQPVLAGCITCRVFATNGGNQSRKLNKHIDFNEIVKLILLQSRFHRVKILITHRNHWTQTISDRMPRPWSTSSCALLWPGRWVFSQETAVRTENYAARWWRQCRLVNPRHQIVISVIFPSGSGVGSFLHLGSDHLLQDFKSYPHKGSRIIKVSCFQRLLCQRFARTAEYR